MLRKRQRAANGPISLNDHRDLAAVRFVGCMGRLDPMQIVRGGAASGAHGRVVCITLTMGGCLIGGLLGIGV